MKLFLDSSAIIEFMRGNSSAVAMVTSADELYTSSLCAYEVLLGEDFRRTKGQRSSYDNALRFFESILTMQFTHEDSVKAARIAANLKLKGKMIDDFDILIAAQAIEKGATILTTDLRHFGVLRDELGLSMEKIG